MESISLIGESSPITQLLMFQLENSRVHRLFFSDVAIECVSTLRWENLEEKSQAPETARTLRMRPKATLTAHRAVFGR